MRIYLKNTRRETTEPWTFLFLKKSPQQEQKQEEEQDE